MGVVTTKLHQDPGGGSATGVLKSHGSAGSVTYQAPPPPPPMGPPVPLGPRRPPRGAPGIVPTMGWAMPTTEAFRTVWLALLSPWAKMNEPTLTLDNVELVPAFVKVVAPLTSIVRLAPPRPVTTIELLLTETTLPPAWAKSIWIPAALVALVEDGVIRTISPTTRSDDVAAVRFFVNLVDPAKLNVLVVPALSITETDEAVTPVTMPPSPTAPIPRLMSGPSPTDPPRGLAKGTVPVASDVRGEWVDAPAMPAMPTPDARAPAATTAERLARFIAMFFLERYMVLPFGSCSSRLETGPSWRAKVKALSGRTKNGLKLFRQLSITIPAPFVLRRPYWARTTSTSRGCSR